MALQQYWIKADGSIYSIADGGIITPSTNVAFKNWSNAGHSPRPWPRDADDQQSYTALEAGIRDLYAVKSADPSHAALGAGSTLASASPITATITYISAADASHVGVSLPAAAPGDERLLINSSAQTIKVFPQAADTIDGGSAGAAVSLSTTKRAWFISTGSNTWISAQLGAVSA